MGKFTGKPDQFDGKKGFRLRFSQQNQSSDFSIGFLPFFGGLAHWRILFIWGWDPSINPRDFANRKQDCPNLITGVDEGVKPTVTETVWLFITGRHLDWAG